jgi:hypothetical protein
MDSFQAGRNQCHLAAAEGKSIVLNSADPLRLKEIQATDMLMV